MSVVLTFTALPVSVVADTLKPNERKTMSYQHNPTPTELRDAYEVAYGDQGVYFLAGAMYANLDMDIINKLYNQALEKVREDMKEKGLV
jgi:hypothetical protein